MSSIPSLTDLNASATEDEFVQRAEFLVENSPWVLESVARTRPYHSVDELCIAIEKAIESWGREEQLRLIRAHPALAGSEAQAGTMTADSTSEQGRLGLLSLSSDELKELQRLNALYFDRFKFHCIIALFNQSSLDSVFTTIQTRLQNDDDVELQTCLSEIYRVIRNRARRL